MELVTEAKGMIDNLSVEDVRKELSGGAAVLVDVRDQNERVEHGAIPGSVHVSRGMLEFAADPSSPYHKDVLDPKARVILHCAAGGRSALAARTLKDLGYTNVAHLETGFNGWRDAGGAIDKV
jgi:rhodanese-related sulfurtransferase